MNTAPYRLDLAPGAVLAGVTTDLSIYCGVDWSLQVPFTASDGVTPVTVSTPEMQIRAQADSGASLLLTPTLSAR